MKNVKIKIASQYESTIKNEFEYVFPLLQKAEEITLKMSEWDMFDRDGKEIQNGKKALTELSNGNPEIEESIRYVFSKLIDSAKYSNSAYTLYFSGERTPSNLQTFVAKFIKKNSREPNEVEKSEIENHVNELNLRIKHYDRLEKAKIFPIGKCSSDVSKYILNTLFAKLASTKAQRKSCDEKYTLLLDINQKVLTSGLSELSNNTKIGIRMFLRICNENSSPVNPKMINYISQQSDIIPEIGKWGDKNGSNRSYSLNKNITEFLNGNKDVVDFIKDKKYRIVFYKYVKLQEKLRKNKKIPQYTYFTKESFKLGYDYSGNAPWFEFIKNDGFKSEWKLARMNDPKDKGGITIQCHHRKTGRSNYQLMDLNVSEFKDGYNISYRQNGKYPVNGTFTNPSINYKNGKYFINLPITENVDEKRFKEIEKIQYKLRTAYTHLTTSSLAEETHELLSKTESPFRMLGVDLNLKGVAHTIKEYQQKTRSWKIIHDGWNSVSGEEVKKYIDLSSDIYKARKLIQYTKEAFSHVKSGDVNESIVKKNNPSLYSFVKSKVEQGWDLLKFKTSSPEEWEVKLAMDKLNKKFGQIRKDRLVSYDEMGMFYYAAVVKEVNSINKAYSTLGTDPSRTNESGINKLKNNKICKNLTESYENIKVDAEKKFAAYIKNISVNYNVSIVVVEELSAQSGDRYENTTRKNELNLMWNPGGIKKYLESSLNSVGIVLEEGSEYLTSQIDPETKQIGYREGNNLYTLNKNKDGIIQKNCHITASENLLDNFVSHYSIPYSFKVKKDPDKDNVYKLETGKKNLDEDINSAINIAEETSIEDIQGKVKSESKRMKYKILKTFGKDASKKEFKISNPPISPKTKEVLTSFNLFNIDGKWVSPVEKDTHLEKIKSHKGNR